MQRVAKHLYLPLIVGDYDPKAWLFAVRGLEQEPEGGERCVTCFAHRLEATAHYAKTQGFDVFASTLTVGRNKKAEIINPLGGKIAKKIGIPFLARDFKKHGGTNFSVTCAEHFGIARQTYCGCVFSHKESVRHDIM